MIDTKTYVAKQIEERDIRFLRLWFTDIFGNLKSFAVTPSDLDEAFEEGVGFDGYAIAGMTDGADQSDMIVRPDPTTFQVLPWRPHNKAVARMICDVCRPDGTPAPSDTRHILMRVLDRAKDMGFMLNVGTELEYFYFKSAEDPEPLDRGGYFDLTPLDNASDLRRETILALEQMGIPVESSLHEAGPSQHEIDLHYCDALSAADNVVTARLAVKEIACAHDVYATFMPKPLAGEPGSSMHVHESLFTEDGNAFFDASDPDGYGLSDLAKHYIAGILHYAPEFMLVTNQYVNSYKRLAGDEEVPSHICWGNRNRSTFVRVPRYKPSKELAARIELRSVDSAANPYLAFAITLAAGLKGISDELPLPAPVDADLFAVSEQELAEHGIAKLPSDLSRAIDAFEQSEFVHEVLGDYVCDFLVKAKRAEWEAYNAQISPWELERFLPSL
jgi:glutamine synthetase